MIAIKLMINKLLRCLDLERKVKSSFMIYADFEPEDNG